VNPVANREGIESGTAPPRFSAAPLPSPLAVAIEPSLRLQSPENGNICGAGRRLSAVGPAKTTKWEGGDRRLGRESPLLAGLSHVPEDTATTGGLAGWRCSADCTSLQPNSLQTGNFTGNFCILGLL